MQVYYNAHGAWQWHEVNATGSDGTMTLNLKVFALRLVSPRQTAILVYVMCPPDHDI